MKRKIIIAGGRDFDNYSMLCDCIIPLIEAEMEKYEIEIVSGHARGADRLGERFAHENHLPVKIFSADWDTYGQKAGIIRNEEMGNYADFLIAFWDGKSRGTQHMIDYMQNMGKHGKVFYYTVERSE